MKNELLESPIKKLYFRYLFLAIGSSLIVSIYSMVDMICVGHYVGSDGTAAIATVNPLWSLMISSGMLFGIGGSILYSHCKAQGKEDPNKYFTVSLVCACLIALILLIVYNIWLEQLLGFFGASGEILTYAKDYAKWISYAVPFFVLANLLIPFIRNDEAPGLCTLAIVSGGIFNVFGDVFFVFDFGLGMGMSGAGLATAVGQMLACLILLTYFFRKKCHLRIVKVDQVLKRVTSIFLAGFGPAIIDLTFGIVTIVMNHQLQNYGSKYELAVYGAISTFVLLFQSMFYGVGQGIQPLISANYGGRKYDRVRTTLRYTFITIIIMSALFLVLIEAMPLTILELFMTSNEQVVAIAPTAFRIYALVFLFLGFNVVSTYYLQSLLFKVEPLTISLLRGFILPCLFAFILPLMFSVSSLWFVMPLSELFCFAMTAYSTKKAYRRLKEEENDTQSS